MTVKEAAYKWEMSVPNVFFYLDQGRVPGAKRQQQSTWFIPDNAQRPKTNKRGRKPIMRGQEMGNA
jgi:hypothetical protein